MAPFCCGLLLTCCALRWLPPSPCHCVGRWLRGLVRWPVQCPTCQINKLGTLGDGEVTAFFDAENVALFRADFANHEPAIAEALARHGSAGVPLYLVYPAGGGEPEVLPPLLTRKIVIQSVERAVNS